MSEKTTPIRVYETDLERLQDLGEFEDTYAEVIERLLDSTTEQEQEQETTASAE